MTANVIQPIVSIEGTPFKDGEKDMTLRSILLSTLNYEDQELQPSAEQKMRAYRLALEIINKDEVTLQSEDIVFIKARLLKLWNAWIYGQVVDMLEGKTEESAK
jgi:hypothetical protein